MSFNIDITVASAEATIARNEQALDRAAASGVEAKASISAVGASAVDAGKKLADAGESGDAALRKVTASAAAAAGDIGKLNQLIGVMKDDTAAAGRAADGTGRSMADWAAQMEREAKIVERIRAPMREYKADLDALDALLKKGTLTTAEYTDEVDRLIKKSGTMQGPKQQATPAAAAAHATSSAHEPEHESEHESMLNQGFDVIAPKLGAAGELLHEFATEGAIGAAAIAAVVAEVTHLGNEYIELANKAQKLTEKGGDINATLREQLALSKDLHGSLDGTLELYDAVRDGTDELNLSMRDQIELTKDIGSAVVASGKSVEQAGGLMSKLTYAFSSGAIGGRELKGIMKEFPDIAAEFVTAMGHSRKELIDLANKGQVSSDMLIAAFRKMGPEMEEKVGRKAETTSQMWQHFNDTITISVGRLAEATGGFRAFGEVLDGIGKAVGLAAEAMDTFGLSGKQMSVVLGTSTLGTMTELFNDLGASMERTAERVGEFLTHAMTTPIAVDQALVKSQGDITKAYLARMEALKLLGVEEEKNAKTAEVAASAAKIGIDVGGFDEAAANKVAEMRITMRQSGIDIGDAFDTAHSEAVQLGTQLDKIKESKAVSELADDAKRIWQEMHGANEIMDVSIKKWTDLADKVHVARQAVEKWKSLTPDGTQVTQDQRELQRGIRDMETEQALSKYGKTVVGIQQQKDQAGDSIRDLSRALKDGEIDSEQYRQRYNALVTTINDGRLPEVIKIWEALHMPQEQFARDTRAATALLEAGRISVEQYRVELQKLADTAGNGDIWRILDQHRAPIKVDSQANDYAAEQAALAHQRLVDEKMDALDKQYARPDNADKNRGAYGQTDGPDLEADLSAFDKRNDALAALGRSTGALDEAERKHVLVVQAERDVMRQLLEPTERYSAQMEGLGKLLADKTITAAQYSRSVDQIRASELAASDAGKTLAGGLESQWLKAKADAEGFGAAVAGTAVNGVDKFNAAFLDMVNNSDKYNAQIAELQKQLQAGKITNDEYTKQVDAIGVHWGDVVDSVIQDLERLIVKQVEVMAITALLNAIVPGSGTTAGVTGATGSLVNALPSGSGPITLPSQVSLGQTPGIYPSASPATARLAPTSAAPVYNLTVVATIDDAVVHAAMNTPGGERVIAAANRKVPGARVGR